MAMFNLLRQRLLTVVILAVILLLPTLLSAEEYKNIGFKKGVPKELKQKFPICDEFLDVKWIDKKRYIGKLKTNYYVNNENRGIQYFLVNAEGMGSDTSTDPWVFYSSNEQRYNSKAFEKFIQQADYSIAKGTWLTAKKGKKKEEFTQFSLPFHPKGDKEFTMKSFAGFTKNICLLYPDDKAVLIVEGKKPFQVEHLTGEIKEKYENILKMATKKCREITRADETIKECQEIDRGKYKDKCDKPEGYICGMKSVKYGTLVDVNFDDVKEYVSAFGIYIDAGGGKDRGLLAKGFIIFFKNEKLEFLDLPDGRCTGIDNFYLSAKKREILSKNCNLTELTGGR